VPDSGWLFFPSSSPLLSVEWILPLLKKLDAIAIRLIAFQRKKTQWQQFYCLVI
jgi:hypothetical protein